MILIAMRHMSGPGLWAGATPTTRAAPLFDWWSSRILNLLASLPEKSVGVIHTMTIGTFQLYIFAESIMQNDLCVAQRVINMHL